MLNFISLLSLHPRSMLIQGSLIYKNIYLNYIRKPPLKVWSTSEDFCKHLTLSSLFLKRKEKLSVFLFTFSALFFTLKKLILSIYKYWNCPLPGKLTSFFILAFMMSQLLFWFTIPIKSSSMDLAADMGQIWAHIHKIYIYYIVHTTRGESDCHHN